MDSEEIVTNTLGGKQSKLYTAYHLIDPWALEALASIHHRGAIKYNSDNWRNIPIEEHINHAMHHITQAMKDYTNSRLGKPSPIWDTEDHLVHALCRITFAKAMEISQNGQHPEHSDPTYHEVKAPPAERDVIRNNERGVGPIPPTEGFDERARGFAALVNKARRDNLKRPSSATRSAQLGIGTPPVRNRRRG